MRPSEQEVAASKTISAVEMVVLADERRTALLKEEKELTKQLEEGGVKYVQQEKLKGESLAQTYLQQMEALCKQQKLLASQLHDCIVPLLDRSA